MVGYKNYFLVKENIKFMFIKKTLKLFLKILLDKLNLKLIRNKHKFLCQQKVIEDSLTIYQNHLSREIEKKSDFKRPLFIDMGSNLGQGFDYFSKYFSPIFFDYIFLEPSPKCFEYLKENIPLKIASLTNNKRHKKFINFEILNVAVSDKNGETYLYGLTEDERGDTSEGTSINRYHNSKFYKSNKNKAITVKTISAGDLINKYSRDRDIVIIKMDIEGAEYHVIEDIIKKDALKSITRIYIEWHTKYFSYDEKGKYEQWEKDLKISLGDKAKEWH